MYFTRTIPRAKENTGLVAKKNEYAQLSSKSD